MAEIDIWSIVLPPQDEVEVVLPADVRITNISFGEELPDANGRSVVKLLYEPITANLSDDEDEDDEEKPPKPEEDVEIATTVLTALTAGRTEQSTVNVVLKGEHDYILSNSGKNPVYVTGNYIEHSDEPPYDSDEEEDDEDDYDLREVSSDVEMDPLELEGISDDEETDASRFEEVVEAPSKSNKRPREAEAAEEKKPKDKKNKKLKAEDGKAVPAAKEEKKEEKKEKKEKPSAKELPGGLKIQDSKVGEGPEAKKGSKVSMRYIGKLENGKIFDKNVKGKPFQFVLGKGNVIKGWDEGIVGMRVGGERILTIPPAMAYGKKGVEGIPPNSTLKFEVKLIQIS